MVQFLRQLIDYRIAIGEGLTFIQVYTEMCKDAGVKTIAELNNITLTYQVSASNMTLYHDFWQTEIPNKYISLY